MGYYTYFTCTTDATEKQNEAMYEWAMLNIKDITYALPDFEGGCGQDSKWYDYERDMVNLSSQFPDVTFTLNGEGEESLDVWTEKYKGGKAIYSETVENQLARYSTLLDLCKSLFTGSEQGADVYNKIENTLKTWGEL